MRTFRIPCSFPTDPVHVFFFTEVSNVVELKTGLLTGNPEYLYAFLDAELIVSQMQLLAAVNRALHDEYSGTMRTKHLHSEVVYALAATQNIGEAFKTFGLNDTTNNIIIVKISSVDPKEIAENVRSIVNGREVPFEDDIIQSLTNLAKVYRHYKLGSENCGNQKHEDGGNRRKDLGECTKIIVGSIALRGSS